VSRTVVYMSMSLDGFVAAEGDGPGRGLGVGGEPLHAWMRAGADPDAFRPADPVDAAILDELMASGAIVTGRHTFEWAGEWGGDHHGVPIFVLTRTERPTRGLVHYVADLAAAVAQAKEAAGGRHVMVHGASSVQALLRAGLVDELVLSVVPILLGRGTPLFRDVPARLRLVRSEAGAGVLHLRYEVEKPR
jgi:dihydrofolate reductase